MTRQGTTKQIRVMISSRCSDQIRRASGEPIGMSGLRFDMKEQIESAEIFGKKSFQCFVHEHEPPLSAIADFWDECLDQVQECDILIVLYNGNAGFANKDGDLGICHAELMRALDTAPGKVRIVDVRRDASLPELPVYPKDQMERNQRFAEYLAFKQRGVRFAKDAEDAIEQTRAALQDAVVDLVTWGGREARKGRFDEGAPLVWSRMDYSTRKREMEAVLRRHLAPDVRSAKQPITKRVDDATVLFCCHAVPSAMSTAAAREMVGRPFLK